jgi:hypothetical protein
LFENEKSMGSLQFFEPQKVNGKIVVKLFEEAAAEGLRDGNASLVGQFLGNTLPFFLVKRPMHNI